MKKKIRVSSLFFLLSAAGCFQQEKPPNFVGTYVFNKSPLKDSLFIVNDSTYRHIYWTSENDKCETQGIWIYRARGKEILFKNFVFFKDNCLRQLGGNWFSKVRISSEGQINLMYSRENNIFYMKIDEKNDEFSLEKGN